MIETALVVPFFNHEAAIERTIDGLRSTGLRCWLVDDGSHAPSRPVIDRIAHREAAWLTVLRHPRNRGKGAAVVTGLRAAAAAGASHALQVDADGQHDLHDIPRLIERAARSPAAIVTGVPVFDQSVPRARLHGRQLTRLWVGINTWSWHIADSMCGFRVYPLAPILRLLDAGRMGRHMEFDPEILVRAVWAGMEVIGVSTRVAYPPGGVSHFHLLKDNMRISAMHARLFFGMLVRAPILLARTLRRVRA